MIFEEGNLFGDSSLDRYDYKYSTSTNSIQYTPNESNTYSIYDLFDDRKTKELIHDISISDISEEQKLFLTLAAYRHVKFNYKRIADYYCNASKDMQTLMENSALVILDFDDAIENGFVKFSKSLMNIIEADKAYKERLSLDER